MDIVTGLLPRFIVFGDGVPEAVSRCVGVLVDVGCCGVVLRCFCWIGGALLMRGDGSVDGARWWSRGMHPGCAAGEFLGLSCDVLTCCLMRSE